NREFYYPPKKSVPIELRDKKGEIYFKETKYAIVNLIPIPFVSIREKLTRDMLDEPRDPATLMLSIIREEPFHLTIDFQAQKLIYKNLEIDMMPARLALYTFFAMQKKECTIYSSACRNCTRCYLDIQQVLDKQGKITELYRKISCAKAFSEMSDSGIIGLNPENFNSYKSKIKEDLKKGFGMYALPELEIESAGKRPDTKYGIKIDRDRIRMTF
ncbi:MAG TPA: TIGR02584 family CRISPR-associated protein, partial [Desulfobacteraceae bacterium]|nr:TIGR02584 family CRISPR-associated protein [Desulfobacteraceae bacterium]